MTDRREITERLVRATSRGSQRSFGHLHRRLTPSLFLWASLHVPPALRRDLEPDDLVQEIWSRAYRDFDRYDRAKGRFRSWLFGIAYNVLRAELRGLRTRRRAEPSAAAGNGQDLIADDATSVGTRVVRQESLRRLLALIEALPEQDRRLVLLRGLEGLPHEEVGRRLGLGAEAAESRWRRLRQRLRRRETVDRD